MSVFGGLSDEGLEETQDRVGGYQPFDTDAYHSRVTMAYALKSGGGAQGVYITADINGKEYRETIYVTDKKGQNFFLNKQDQTKKVPLPGFTTINDMCLVTTNQPLSAQATEEKMVNVYDSDLKKEVPKSVPVLVDLIGKELTLGIVRQLENKNVKQGNDYVPIADTREVNFIDKVFHYPTGGTVVEARNNQEPGGFLKTWTERNKGQTRDKRTIKDGQGGTAGRPGATAQSGPPQSGDAAPKKSLFN